jgi:hypothetical protein
MGCTSAYSGTIIFPRETGQPQARQSEQSNDDLQMDVVGFFPKKIQTEAG